MKAVADATAFDLCCDESAEGLTSQSLRDSFSSGNGTPFVCLA